MSNKKRTSQQSRAIIGLLAGATQREAARVAGVLPPLNAAPALASENKPE